MNQREYVVFKPKHYALQPDGTRILDDYRIVRWGDGMQLLEEVVCRKEFHLVQTIDVARRNFVNLREAA